MNQRFAPWLALLCLLLGASSACAAQPMREIPLKTTMRQDPYASDGLSFRALCYHDARDNLRDTLKAWPESAALDTRDLIEHFEWLRESGYHIVSLDAILAARNGGPKLPAKAVLLTFDDGYASMYTRVFPLLKLFNYPAVIGLVGEWLEAAPGEEVLYGDQWMPRENFVTWPQVREMAASGLVEVASHSHSLHKGAISNPQGNSVSAAITRSYDPASKQYESDAAYFERIRADLARNSALIEREIGRKPRVMIWPYGAYNMTGISAANAAGMPFTMNLDAGPNTPAQPLARIRRDILFFNDKVSDLKRNLNQRAEYDGADQPLQRIVTVELDAIYDPDPAQQERKLGALIEHILRLHINTVYLRAVADADGDGLAEAAYFPNRHLPLRADLVNRVAWQLRTRAAVAPEYIDVFPWLPVLAFELPPTHPAGSLPNATSATSTRAPAGVGTPTHLSSPAPAARTLITEIYEDLGKNAPRVAGLVLGPDAALDENDDLAAFVQQLAAAFKLGQPNAVVTRMIDASALPAPQRNAELPQSFASALTRYDYLALLLAPQARDAHKAGARLADLVDSVARVPGALDQTAFVLPAAEQAQLNAELKLLQRMGARNFGYHPVNALAERPLVLPIMSLKTNPGRQP